MTEMMTSNDSAQAAREGIAMMRAGEAQMAEGALKAAEALHRERVRLKNDIAFGRWCNANGLGEDVISKNERAALIKVGADIPYWRGRIVEAKGRSIRMIVENNPPPEVPLWGNPPYLHATPQSRGRSRRSQRSRRGWGTRRSRSTVATPTACGRN